LLHQQLKKMKKALAKCYKGLVIRYFGKEIFKVLFYFCDQNSKSEQHLGFQILHSFRNEKDLSKLNLQFGQALPV